MRCVKFTLFTNKDFYEAVCIGPLNTMLDRVVDSANEILSDRKPLVGIHDDDPSQVWALRHISAKLKGLSFLIQRLDADGDAPADASETYWGIGLMIEDLGKKIKDVSRILEWIEMEADRSKENEESSVNSAQATAESEKIATKAPKTTPRPLKKTKSVSKRRRRRANKGRS
jgi:hypothetical protein